MFEHVRSRFLHSCLSYLLLIFLNSQLCSCFDQDCALSFSLSLSLSLSLSIFLSLSLSFSLSLSHSVCISLCLSLSVYISLLHTHSLSLAHLVLYLLYFIFISLAGGKGYSLEQLSLELTDDARLAKGACIL